MSKHSITPMPTLESLRYRHPEHVKFCTYWELLTALVEGADSMTNDVKRKLLPNPESRPEQVMKDRVELATYCNKVAPILSRFNSELFTAAGVPTGSKDSFWQDEFFKYGALVQGDDDGRASFNTFLMQSMMQALTTGKAIAQIDTKSASGATTLAQQQQSGELNPYVILHPRSAMWDWEGSSNGFEFVKLHQFKLIRDRWDSTPVAQHSFTIYYRQGREVRVSKYSVRKVPKDNEICNKPFIDSAQEKEVIISPEIEDQVIFNHNGKFEFPIVTLNLPKSLWMGAQLFDCQASYFRQTAALEYALYTNNCAMPVITGVDSDSDDPLIGRKIGEGYYLTLKTGQDITSFERNGTSVETAIAYRNEIKRDIYDVLQQIAMSASDGTSVIARSGESKKEDRRPEEILLERYGQAMKEFILQILKPAAIAHREDVNWEVSGYDDYLTFSIEELLADMGLLDQADIPSPSFKKEMQKVTIKRFARRYDIDSDAVERAIAEIDSFGTKQNQVGF